MIRTNEAPEVGLGGWFGFSVHMNSRYDGIFPTAGMTVTDVAIAGMPPTEPIPNSVSRPTVRMVAARAGVSAMTVSRALRNQSTVSPNIRVRVLAAARDLGYRPDPEVAKLMHHLRSRRKPAFQGSLCALTTVSPHAPYRDYSQAIVTGARRQAQAHGYGFSTLLVDDPLTASRSLQRILRGRDVDGIILLPMAEPTRLTEMLDWSAFSAVATTSSVLAPELHCVMPHHLRNTQMLCRELHARGYRRIGLVLREEQIVRVQHAVTAAVVWHELFQQGTFVPPLVYHGAQPRDLTAWFRREQPDVIVTHTERLCRAFAQTLGLAIPGPVGFVSTYTTIESVFAGIDELPEQIGLSAVDLLTGMIQRGEKGVPAVPSALQLQGRWVAGRSCPKRRTRSASPQTLTGITLMHREPDCGERPMSLGELENAGALHAGKTIVAEQLA